MKDKLTRYNITAEKLRTEINARPLTDFYKLEKSKGSLFVCPICGSGNHANHTGALSIKAGNYYRVKCFASNCFGEKGQDTLGALRQLMPEKSEKEIFQFCGYDLTGTTAPAKTAAPEESSFIGDEKTEEHKTMQNQPIKKNFSSDIEKYHAALSGSEGEQYLLSRGFTKDTMNRFNLGYKTDTHYITIPYDRKGSYYGQRSTDQKNERKHNNLKGAVVPLFNPAALAADICFIVESPLCAISIEQAGGHAVALSGVGHKNLLLEKLRSKPIKGVIALCMDNDEAGKRAAEELGQELDKIIPSQWTDVSEILLQDLKDPNEVLKKDGTEILKQRIEDASQQIRNAMNQEDTEKQEERKKQTGAEMVHEFLEMVQTDQYKPVPTGIKTLDDAIGGGFIRQQLVLLGAAPGAGKTALAQWIFEGMAAKGNQCIYLNLEMSREQMIARSLSRIVASQGASKPKIKTTDILQGYKWSETQRRRIFEAASQYSTTIAPNMIYNPKETTADLDSILNYIEAEAIRAETAGNNAPFIVLDYLQIVGSSQKEDNSEIIKRAVSSLKNYAIRHNTVVFVIIAHNRQSNKSGIATMEAGRDTSALEYSADLQLALTFTDCLSENGTTADKIKPERKPFVTLVVTKARFGRANTQVNLKFTGETMSYEEIKESQKSKTAEANTEDIPTVNY